MLDICVAVLFVNGNEACVAWCSVQEKGLNDRMVDEVFGRIVKIGIVGGNPPGGMSFEAISEFVEELLAHIFSNIGVEEKVVMHVEVLEIEKRRLGNDLTGRGVKMRVNVAGYRSRFGCYGVGPRVGVAEGVVFR